MYIFGDYCFQQLIWMQISQHDVPCIFSCVYRLGKETTVFLLLLMLCVARINHAESVENFKFIINVQLRKLMHNIMMIRFGSQFELYFLIENASLLCGR